MGGLAVGASAGFGRVQVRHLDENSTTVRCSCSGGHKDGFEAICDELAARIGASRARVEGAGHEIQFTGPPLDDLLLDLRGSSQHA